MRGGYLQPNMKAERRFHRDKEPVPRWVSSEVDSDAPADAPEVEARTLASRRPFQPPKRSIASAGEQHFENSGFAVFF